MTAQFGERLLLDGEELGFRAAILPLSPVLAARGIRFSAECTALWRGCIGTWSLRNGLLFLEGIAALSGTPPRDEAGRKVTLRDLFPDQPPPVPATWFSGTLTHPFGKLLEYRHAGFASVHEFERDFTFVEGRCVSDVTRRNSAESLRARRETLMRTLREARAKRGWRWPWRRRTAPKAPP